ncbi:trigger factor [Rhodobacterales bacterium 52_120_T64]|nr:trigger factor [Rhodobacterales bacterium 52_120_T64]
MQVTETLNEGLTRAYDVTITAAELEAKVTEKLEAARADFQMKGFRKGHAPLALMKKMFGQSVMGEAMQEAVDGAVGEHFEKTGDRPAMQPEIKMTNDEWKEGDEVAVSVSYECLPTIPEADFSKIKLERLVTEIEDAAVTEALENLASSTSNYEKRRKGSKAKDADQVVIDFLGKVDGEAFDGGAGEDYPLVLGSNSFIPGFEEQLVGAKEGEELDVNVTFPAEYGAEALAGKDAVFSCTVKEVREPKPAPIDEELATKYGAESLEDLTKQITGRLENEYAGASRAIMKRKLMDELDEQVKFELPPSLVKAEANQIAHQLWHDDNPDVEGHDHPEIETTDEHNTLAERRVRLGLLLAEIGNQNNVEVSEQEIQQAMFQQASQYPGQEREFFEFMQKNEQAQQQMRAPIYEDKVVDFIIELAEVSDKTVSKDELETAIKGLDEE